MYKEEFRIVFNEEDNRLKQGNFFEEIVSRIIKTHRYSVKERVNFTGMEIDLIASHKDRVGETLYVECKARDTLSSSDISSFAFKTQLKKASFGYFISTTEFVHQVSGLITEIKNNENYKNLYFFGPSKVIRLLEETKTISNFSKLPVENVVKVIVLYTYFGIFKALLISNGTISTEFSLVDKDNEFINDDDIVNKIQSYIKELSDLKYVDLTVQEVGEVIGKEIFSSNSEIVETIAEVKRSEEWYDYLPTSRKHFIGRKDIMRKYNDFISNIENGISDKRVFYIEGKSGWGKSSFVSTIRDNSNVKSRRKKEFVFAIDTRSATTSNFVGLAFRKMYESALIGGFLADFEMKNEFNILSNHDVLGSEFVKSLMSYLEYKEKHLIIIFDQFEDIFRNETIFEVFYKFLNDVNNLRSNIIVGFSWKSEITVPIQHSAYHLWQVIKSETFCIEMREFDSREVSGVINQLQKSINFKLDLNIKRRITESSQGFPWLTKKICIHTLNEINNGVTVNELLEQELNIVSLFKKDLEGVNPDELTALRYIAKRADDGNMFDITEIDTMIEQSILTSLINKRLVIRSGPKYNIYWDVFRDYLVHGEVQMIGESYIIRQRPNVCFELFKHFKFDTIISFEMLVAVHKEKYSKNTLFNILRQLLDLSVINLSEGGYRVNGNIKSLEKKEYVNFVQKKFARYVPYIRMKERQHELTSVSQVKDILQDVFPSVDIKDNTWETYTKNLISWISYLGLDGIENIEYYSFDYSKNGSLPSRKSTTQAITFTPQKPITDDIDVFLEIIENKDDFDIKKNSKFLYDLSAIGVLHYWKDDVIVSKKGLQIAGLGNRKLIMNEFAILAKQMDKISKGINIINEKNISKIKEFRANAQHLVANINSDIYKRQSLGKIFNWANFVVECEEIIE